MSEKSDVTLSADSPIDEPAQDAFGFDPFARAIATSIAELEGQNGIVIGIHGPWGSGKSSAVNLIKHHLASGEMKGSENLTVIEFNPWWFIDAESLALGFFRELGSTISKSLSKKAKDAFRSLGKTLGRAGPLFGAAANIASGGVAGAAAGAATSLLGDILGAKQTVQQEHATIAKALKESNRRFLVVIDDLDRLNPDDLLLVFKLVKSAGHLPNVIYLMVFDRDMAEAAINESFPSESPHYLEKIVQASFQLPIAEAEDLRDVLLGKIDRLMGIPGGHDAVRFMNVFYDVIAPNISRPRDVLRLVNALEVTYPAVANEIDRTDFLAIETLRLSWPKVYQAIYRNRSLVCGIGDEERGQTQGGEECDNRLLADVAQADRPLLREALKRLFPALEGRWGNHFYNLTSANEWHVQRRVCADAHFGTYFRLTLSDATVSSLEVYQLIDEADNSDATVRRLLEAAATTRRRGGTRASVLLDELNMHATEIPENKIAPMVKAIFSIADALNVKADEAKGFSIGDNYLRIQWLLNRLVTDRVSVATRDLFFEEACDGASTGWLIDFVVRCCREHEPMVSDQGTRTNAMLVTEPLAMRLKALAIDRIQRAAHDGSLIRSPNLVQMLFGWRHLLPNEHHVNVREWVTSQLISDRAVISLADQFVSIGWTQSAGDRVSTSRPMLRRETVEDLTDEVAFRSRVAELIERPTTSGADRAALNRFEHAWANPSRH